MRGIQMRNLHGYVKMTNTCIRRRTTGLQEDHHWKRSQTYPEHRNLEFNMANKMFTEDSNSSKDRIQISIQCPEEE